MNEREGLREKRTGKKGRKKRYSRLEDDGNDFTLLNWTTLTRI